MSGGGALLGALGLAVLAAAAWAWVLPAPPGRLRAAHPATRADLALAAAAGAALVGAVVLGGALLAPGLGAIGLGVDHCDDHGGHAHLCLLHGPASPGLVGGAGLALLLARLPAVARAAWALLRAERLGAALARRGALEGGVLVVPTAAPLCHTVGLLRPVSLIGATLRSSLPAPAFAALRAHEAAHRAAHDTRAAALLALAAAAFPALEPWRSLWAEAAEELADEAAAAQTDRLSVADALVRVAAAGPAPGWGVAAAGHGVERRVRLLLTDAPLARPRRAGWALGLVSLAAAGALALGRHELHHAAETVWSLGLLSGW